MSHAHPLQMCSLNTRALWHITLISKLSLAVASWQCVLTLPADRRLSLHSYSSPVCHDSHYGTQARDIDYLLMPTQNYAHGSTGGLVRGPRPGCYLAKAGMLRVHSSRRPRGAPCSARRRGRGHALVSAQVKPVNNSQLRHPLRQHFSCTHKYFIRTSSSSPPPSDL